jgi:solute carrier family 25 (adenine nucleotide translocator) protein 4/5/6/31
MMTQSLKTVKEYSGTLDCFGKIYRAEGLAGYWKGAYTNAIRSIGSSLCLVLYDELGKVSSRL